MVLSMVYPNFHTKVVFVVYTFHVQLWKVTIMQLIKIFSFVSERNPSHQQQVCESMGQQSYIRFHLNLYRFSTISPVLLLILVSQVKCIPPSQPNSQDLKTLFSSIKPPNSTESITLSMSTTTTTPPLLNREDNDDIGTGRPWRIEHG